MITFAIIQDPRSSNKFAYVLRRHNRQIAAQGGFHTVARATSAARAAKQQFNDRED